MEVEQYAKVLNKLSSEQVKLLRTIEDFQGRMRESVLDQLLTQSSEYLSQVAGSGAGDISYRVDKFAERFIGQLGEDLSQIQSVEVISEGVGRMTFPRSVKNPVIKALVDPVDGTRGIMYDLYSAWVETGIAKNKGDSTSLADIDLAIMTEIPTTKQKRGSVVWAARGLGAYEEVWDLVNERWVSVKKLQSSSSPDLLHGFAVFADPFSNYTGQLGEFRKTVMDRLLGLNQDSSIVFNDQILTSAGQIYNLATGKYRFFADILPKFTPNGLCTHPYDLATMLVAEEAGVIITDTEGKPLSYPLDTDTNCSLIGYANQEIRSKVEPILLEELAKI